MPLGGPQSARSPLLAPLICPTHGFKGRRRGRVYLLFAPPRRFAGELERDTEQGRIFNPVCLPLPALLPWLTPEGLGRGRRRPGDEVRQHPSSSLTWPLLAPSLIGSGMGCRNQAGPSRPGAAPQDSWGCAGLGVVAVSGTCFCRQANLIWLLQPADRGLHAKWPEAAEGLRTGRGEGTGHQAHPGGSGGQCCLG